MSELEPEIIDLEVETTVCDDHVVDRDQSMDDDSDSFPQIQPEDETANTEEDEEWEFDAETRETLSQRKDEIRDWVR